MSIEVRVSSGGEFTALLFLMDGVSICVWPRNEAVRLGAAH